MIESGPLNLGLREMARSKEIAALECQGGNDSRIIAGAMKIALFPLDVVLFPGAALPLHIFEERYKEMVTGCIARSESFGVVRAQSEGLAVVGCTASVVRVLQRYTDGRMDILCEGGDRFEIEMLDNSRAYLQAEVDLFKDDGQESTRAEREECAGLHFEMMELIGLDEDVALPSHLSVDLDEPISFTLASGLPVDLNFKQDLLMTRSDAERTRKLMEFYHAVLPKLRVGVQTTRATARNGHVM
jgi:Lon protease-like protein